MAEAFRAAHPDDPGRAAAEVIRRGLPESGAETGAVAAATAAVGAVAADAAAIDEDELLAAAASNDELLLQPQEEQLDDPPDLHPSQANNNDNLSAGFDAPLEDEAPYENENPEWTESQFDNDRAPANENASCWTRGREVQGPSDTSDTSGRVVAVPLESEPEAETIPLSPPEELRLANLFEEIHPGEVCLARSMMFEEEHPHFTAQWAIALVRLS